MNYNYSKFCGVKNLRRRAAMMNDSSVGAVAPPPSFGCEELQQLSSELKEKSKLLTGSTAGAKVNLLPSKTLT